jgi:membrane-associated protease RseP (regulator of RpoE activity)
MIPNTSPVQKRSFFALNKVNILLFILTTLSTFFTGMLLSIDESDISSHVGITGNAELIKIFFQPKIIFSGGLFCLAIMSILLAHEMGHYIACRKYNISTTLPYFIPFPTLIGTMGAFIKIKSPITSRKALFDIGAAGPIAGFILTVPWMYVGLRMSYITDAMPTESILLMSDPMLTDLIVRLMGLSIPDGYNLIAHPVYIAAWFGCLATAINLIPVGQLDGGHIIYSLFTSRAPKIYRYAFVITCIIALAAVIMEGFFGWSLWILIIFFLMRKGHPPTLDDSVELGGKRKLLAFVALVIFVLTFMPIPIKFLS